MKGTRLRPAAVCALSLLSASLMACGASRSSEIFKPESYRSPQLDFTKVQAVAIMPVSAFTNEIPELTSLINDGLPAELRRSQTAWRVIDQGEVLRVVNDKDLGRGFQNYVADLNVYAGSTGTGANFTAETKAFFTALRRESNIQAILFVTYGFAEAQGVQTCLLIYTCPVTTRTLRVNVALYELSSQRIWWMSTLTHTGKGKSNTDLAAAVIRGIANDFGKGALRQL